MQTNDGDNEAGKKTTNPRQHWMGVLARTPEAELEKHWQDYKNQTTYQLLRQPEIGLTMVQARAGGVGQRFNLGEMTVTRCSIKIDEGLVGHAYVAGRSRQHAERAAVFDALLQVPKLHASIFKNVIRPLEKTQMETRRVKSQKAAATKVDFFTMVRGEDS